MTKIEGLYLCAEDFEGREPVVKVLKEPMYVQLFNARLMEHERQLVMEVQLLDGTVRKYTPGSRSVRSLVSAWGDETKVWVGRMVAFEQKKQKVGGELKTCLYALPAQDKGKKGRD